MFDTQLETLPPINLQRDNEVYVQAKCHFLLTIKINQVIAHLKALDAENLLATFLFLQKELIELVVFKIQITPDELKVACRKLITQCIKASQSDHEEWATTQYMLVEFEEPLQLYVNIRQEANTLKLSMDNDPLVTLLNQYIPKLQQQTAHVQTSVNLYQLTEEEMKLTPVQAAWAARQAALANDPGLLAKYPLHQL